jgi:restriction system protein
MLRVVTQREEEPAMARRRRKNEIEDLIDLASILPWWLGLAIAVLSYLLLHPLAETPVPTPTNPGDIAGPITVQVIRTGALIGQYLLPIIFVFSAGASALKAYRNKKLLSEAKEIAGSADLVDLSWEDFEHLVGEAFRECGFSVSETALGPDGGVDLELHKDGELHLVQCKRWRARKVGVEIVRELYGVMSARGAVGGYVVSSGTFSQDARNFAKGRNIELWDGSKLKAIIRQERTPPQPRPYPAQTDVSSPSNRGQGVENDTPSCPQCGATMVLRTAKRGVNTGQQFWGCSAFPRCRGTKPLSST